MSVQIYLLNILYPSININNWQLYSCYCVHRVAPYKAYLWY